jgi:hypothetical protein
LVKNVPLNDKKECLKCKKSKRITEFYLSNSPNHSDKKYPVCKTCLKESLHLDNPMSQESINSLKDVLLEMNRPFIYSLYESSVEESARKNRELFGIYLKNIMLNFKDYTWKDSEFESKSPIVENKIEIIDKNNDDVVMVDDRDKEDVVRMIGYDPFEYENQQDKKQLYNRLVDFLDESTLEDGFKLQAVIEIVKGFNQIDKINQAITTITKDVDKLSTNSGSIKSLIDSKKNILASLLKLAEDNGLSVKHNNQKSKGAGTLSGIIKTLHEKGIQAGEINVFDIETCEGMRQVADISNKSIIEQLMLNENDYTEMIKDQKEMIDKMESRLKFLEEENRLMKIKLKQYEQNEEV